MSAAPAAPPPPAFNARALLRRILADWPLKSLGTTVAMTGFFVLYFAVLRHPLYPVALVPATWLDRLVPFAPWTLAPYASLWLYLALLPALLPDRRQLLGFAGGCVVLAAAGLAIFLRWPTAVAPAAIDWSLHPAFRFLKQTDAAGNACPSLHVAFAVFAALWFARLLPALGAGLLVQSASLLWAALIAYSTLATRQHVALDALFGALLGAWVAALNFTAFPPPPDAPALRRPLLLAVAIIKISALLLWSSGLAALPSLALFLSGGALLLHALFSPSAQGLVRVFTRFVPSSPTAPEYWLTLDDGPDPDDTPRILDLLDRHRARATFFLVGERAARHPALVSAILLRGHEIAHHTHTHPCASFWCASPARIRRELDLALAAFAAAGAPPPRRFRAPVGIKNIFLAPALAARRLACVGWALRSRDTLARDPAAVAARVVRLLRPGMIVLLHEGPPLHASVRVAALRLVLEQTTARGYRAVIPADARLY